MSRRLTVSTLHRSSGRIGRERWTKVPQLRLAGKWLRSAGFAAGNRVHVEIRDGALILTTCHPAS